MNPDLKSFIHAVLNAVLPTLFVVAVTAFVSIPYTLGHHPGEASAQKPDTPRHMT